MSETLLHVAAAIIQRPDGQVLLAQRPAGKAYAGYWEFPGGKLEPGETPRAALDRELAEELGLAVRGAAPWLVQRFRYPHAHVLLHFFRVFDWSGEPVGHDGQAFVWQTPGNFDVQPLLPANTFVLRALTLPPVYGISLAEDVGETAFLARAEAALDRGLKLVQLREKGWPEERQRALAAALVALARAARREGPAEWRRRVGARLGLRRRAPHVGAPRGRHVAAGRSPVRSVVPHACRHRSRGRARTRFRGAGAGAADAFARGMRRRSVGRASRRSPPRRRCPSSRWADLRPPIFPSRSQAARMASRCAAARGPPGCPNFYPANDRRAAARVSISGASAVGTRYASLAQAPKSISLHRSEQNGRQRSAAVHATLAPQRGQATLRGFPIRDCRTRARIRRRGRRRCRGPCR